MELRVDPISETLIRIIPAGRWDVQGGAAIDVRLSALTGSGRRIILDMSEVSYLSSMGMRSLVMGSKAAGARGERLVLLSPTPHVVESLTAAAIDQIIQVYDDIDEATRALDE